MARRNMGQCAICALQAGASMNLEITVTVVSLYCSTSKAPRSLSMMIVGDALRLHSCSALEDRRWSKLPAGDRMPNGRQDWGQSRRESLSTCETCLPSNRSGHRGWSSNGLHAPTSTSILGPESLPHPQQKARDVVSLGGQVIGRAKCCCLVPRSLN